MRTLCRKSFAIGLLVAFLVVTTGRAVPVKAVGTTVAAAAGATLAAVGIAYCSYLILTGASVHIPDTVQDIEEWLTDIGSKVVQYPAGRDAYNEIYPQLIGLGDEPLHTALDRAWTWTSEKLMRWADSFSNVDALADIAAYYQAVDVDLYPTNGYTYHITASFPTDIYFDADGHHFEGTVERYIDVMGPLYIDTAHLVYYNYGFDRSLITHSDIPDSTIVRNLRFVEDNRYKYHPQYFDGTTWQTYHSISWRNGYTYVGDRYYDLSFLSNGSTWLWEDFKNSISTSRLDGLAFDDPFFADAVIHDESTDQDLPMVVAPTDLVEYRPQWPMLPSDDDKYPVIPYVQTPFNPNWVDPVTGTPGGGRWGFNLADFLDALEDLAGLLMEIGALGDLINEFKSMLTPSTENNYYIYYNEGDTYYYDYHIVANYGNDVYNVNIDVSHADEELPVDLNTIQQYSNNRYIEAVKEHALAGGSIIRDLVVFWYDVDPEIVYVVFGTCILTLIAAFIGKWGHS